MLKFDSMVSCWIKVLAFWFRYQLRVVPLFSDNIMSSLLSLFKSSIQTLRTFELNVINVWEALKLFPPLFLYQTKRLLGNKTVTISLLPSLSRSATSNSFGKPSVTLLSIICPVLKLPVPSLWYKIMLCPSVETAKKSIAPSLSASTTTLAYNGELLSTIVWAIVKSPLPSFLYKTICPNVLATMSIAPSLSKSAM